MLRFFQDKLIRCLSLQTMLRYSGAILLLFALGIQGIQRTLLVLDYYTNTATFIKNCENKARPQMHCNGQCILMKKLNQHENKDQQAPDRKSENNSDVFAFHSMSSYFNIAASTEVSTKYPPYNISYKSSFSRYCFHPPGHPIA